MEDPHILLLGHHTPFLQSLLLHPPRLVVRLYPLIGVRAGTENVPAHITFSKGQIAYICQFIALLEGIFGISTLESACSNIFSISKDVIHQKLCHFKGWLVTLLEKLRKNTCFIS